ncbi:hypothetical protein [Kitasatospora sp. NPDC088351]|uniref:hypothetical protein n=1 Tax=unclassified Kitasatospora TaxID=2633591 RepID=UPI00341B5D2C
MWSPFRELGDAVAREWRAHDFGEDAFVGIAVRRLSEAACLDEVDALELAARAASEPVLPAQTDLDARFGQPPLTLYSTSRFHMTLLYWLESTTSIHEHAFQGAFRVLHGSSLHSSWRFDESARISGRLLLGRTTRLRSEVLAVGDVRPILPGARGAHALFHLDQPSATLVVRTRSDPGAQPQYEYCPPSLSVNPFDEDPSLTRRLQLLHLLRQEDEKGLREAVRRSLATDDLVSAVTVLLDVCGLDLDGAFTEEAIGLVADRRAEFADPLRAAAREVVRDHRLTALRRRVNSPEARLVLALALNGLDRRGSLDAFAARYGADPVGRMAAGIGDLLSQADGIDPVEPLPEILRLLLGGSPAERVVHELGGRPEYHPRLIEKITDILLRSPTLQRLFR